MTPEQKVTSLELSKQLWDAGLRIETEYWWVALLEQETGKVIRYSLEKRGQYPGCLSGEVWTDEEGNIPAPDAAELLEVMPQGMLIVKRNNKYEVTSRTLEFFNDFTTPRLLHDKLSDSLARFILHLFFIGHHYNPETKMIEVRR